jgi:hypothetical protein
MSYHIEVCMSVLYTYNTTPIKAERLDQDQTTDYCAIVTLVSTSA